jgi:hypothetical protein
MTMPRERLFARTFDVCAPLLLWALHLFGAYVFAATACASMPAEQVRLVLLAWSFIALACAVGLLIRAMYRRRHLVHARLLFGMRLGCAVLGVIGVGWTALPLLVLPSCGA